MNYIIYIADRTFEVNGTEAAWEAFTRALDFGEFLGHEVLLVDAQTGEVVADNLDED